MRWKLFLMTASILMFLLMLGLGFAHPIILASNIAPCLASKLDADEHEVRNHLQTILQENSVRRTMLYCAPWALLSKLLIGRVIADLGSAFLSGWRGEVETNPDSRNN